MPLGVAHLRRWFAVAAILLILMVAGVYFYARHRVENALREIPSKIGVEFQQTANGFTYSSSQQGRTRFKIQAHRAVQFKDGGRADLHDVEITLYGQDSSRFDQIYGSEFEYDPKSGDVVGKGEIQIELEANPTGQASPDQAPPAELKNPIHLTTSDLIFNQKTGDAYTPKKVTFRVPQASGSAVGVTYTAKTSLLVMHSDVQIEINGSPPSVVTAVSGTITKDPRIIVLQQARLENASEHAESDVATLYLRPNNSLQRIFSEGHVLVRSKGPEPEEARSEQLVLELAQEHNELRSATFGGNVQVENSGPQKTQGWANRAVLNFQGRNVLTTVHSEGKVRLLQHQAQGGSQANPQDMELTAPVVDFALADGHRLKSARTSGPPQLTIEPEDPKNGPTIITAGRFEARFDDLGQLSSVHGEPDARIVNSPPGEMQRISTSKMLDATFSPGQGITLVVQQGNVAYADGERKAWGDRARYTPADQVLTLTGSPRLIDGSQTTTARLARMNRATGEGYAEGDVRTTYSDLKPQPNGAMLASSSPIHVAARNMTAHQQSAVALYTGDVRLWQDANLVEAPSIEFDRDRRFVDARASSAQPVSTVLTQTDSSGKVSLMNVTADHLTYADNERRAHYQGNVVGKGDDFTITSAQADIFLEPQGQAAAKPSSTQPAKVERVVAWDNVVIVQPERRGTGDRLVYTVADDKFVLSGGPPSIFDAEHGKITGVSLTFYKRDDRVLVEGNNTSPTVTHTRVAR